MSIVRFVLSGPVNVLAACRCSVLVGVQLATSSSACWIVFTGCSYVPSLISSPSRSDTYISALQTVAVLQYWNAVGVMSASGYAHSVSGPVLAILDSTVKAYPLISGLAVGVSMPDVVLKATVPSK